MKEHIMSRRNFLKVGAVASAAGLMTAAPVAANAAAPAASTAADEENCQAVSYTHLDVYKRQLEAIMDVLLPTIMAFIIDQGIEKGDMNAVIKYGLLLSLIHIWWRSTATNMWVRSPFPPSALTCR